MGINYFFRLRIVFTGYNQRLDILGKYGIIQEFGLDWILRILGSSGGSAGSHRCG